MSKGDEKETVSELSGVTLCLNNWGQVFLQSKSIDPEKLREVLPEDVETIEAVLELVRHMNESVQRIKEEFDNGF